MFSALLEAEVYHDRGSMTGLAVYMRDLAEHLRQELGIPADENPPTVQAMTALGIPPSEWYRVLLQREKEPENDLRKLV